MPRPTNLILLTALFASSAAMAATYPQPLPSGYSPTSGPPGTVITINGSGFTGLTGVVIGNAHDANVYVVNDSLVKVTVPNDATTSHLGLINPQKQEWTSTTFTVTQGSAKSPPTSSPPATVNPPTTSSGAGGASYKISGIVSGTGANGATMTLNGVKVASAKSDGGGSYDFTGLPAGTYTVSANLPGHTFSPAKMLTIGNTDQAWNYNSAATPGNSPTLALATVSTLPNATVGSHYSSTVIRSISGGNSNYHYQTGTTSTGSPPVDMILNPNGTLTGAPATAGRYTFTVCAYDTLGHPSSSCPQTTLTVLASGTTAPPVTTPPVTTPPVTTPPVTTPPVTTPPVASGTSWVYYNGSFDWPGDYSFGAVPNYGDTSGSPLSGGKDIKVTITGQYGGWLPYSQNHNFNSRGYTKLTFSLKPTIANQVWNVFFVKVGDVPVGIYLNPANYGPAPQAGKWATYTIPLADLGVLNASIYKFAIHDETGQGSNTWYVDNVGFVP